MDYLAHFGCEESLANVRWLQEAMGLVKAE